MPSQSQTRPKFEVYPDESGGWRWRLIAANGRLICESGESFKRRHLAIDMTNRLMPIAHDAVILCLE